MRKRLVKKILRHGRKHLADWAEGRAEEHSSYERAMRWLVRRNKTTNRIQTGICLQHGVPWRGHGVNPFMPGMKFLLSWKCRRVMLLEPRPF